MILESKNQKIYSPIPIFYVSMVKKIHHFVHSVLFHHVSLFHHVHILIFVNLPTNLKLKRYIWMTPYPRYNSSRSCNVFRRYFFDFLSLLSATKVSEASRLEIMTLSATICRMIFHTRDLQNSTPLSVAATLQQSFNFFLQGILSSREP